VGRSTLHSRGDHIGAPHERQVGHGARRDRLGRPQRSQDAAQVGGSLAPDIERIGGESEPKLSNWLVSTLSASVLAAG